MPQSIPSLLSSVHIVNEGLSIIPYCELVVGYKSMHTCVNTPIWFKVHWRPSVNMPLGLSLGQLHHTYACVGTVQCSGRDPSVNCLCCTDPNRVGYCSRLYRGWLWLSVSQEHHMQSCKEARTHRKSLKPTCWFYSPDEYIPYRQQHSNTSSKLTVWLTDWLTRTRTPPLLWRSFS